MSFESFNIALLLNMITHILILRKSYDICTFVIYFRDSIFGYNNLAVFLIFCEISKQRTFHSIG